MAKKPRSRFVCQSCGAESPRWSGKCETCGEWNSIVEEAVAEPTPGGLASATKGRKIDFVPLKGTSAPPPRTVTGIAELDRVTGGGFIPGSVVLVGGDPGIGKSTLLLQAAAAIAPQGEVLYISGEEAIEQVRNRAARLELAEAPVHLASETNLRDILASLEDGDPPRLVVIDSIQTMFADTVSSAPGSVSQVRTCAHELIRAAKRRGFTLVLIGHVTKEGTLAGPRVLEHMVDTVLYFEGERGHQFRILRAVKNRYGATDEIGVFEMRAAGLAEIANPSALFLAERRGNVAGSCVFAGVEGTRPLLMEIQALTSPSQAANPRRTVVGWDSGRLAMLMAVIETRCGLAISANDAYLNVAGGLRVAEPAADLAVAAALVSSIAQIPVPAEMVVFGEIGLSGEIRAVAQTDLRLKEAAKLGFTRALIPVRQRRDKDRAAAPKGLDVREIGHVQDLVAMFAQDASGAASQAQTSTDRR